LNGANNNIEVVAAQRPDGGAVLTGSAAICGVDKRELFYNTFRAVGGGNSRASKADRKITDGWLRKSQIIRVAATVAGAAGANNHQVNPANGAAVAAVED